MKSSLFWSRESKISLASRPCRFAVSALLRGAQGCQLMAASRGPFLRPSRLLPAHSSGAEEEEEEEEHSGLTGNIVAGAGAERA